MKEEITIQDIFGVRPKNVYAHLYQELFERPEKEAIIALSAAYGLTPADAELVIQGSVTPLVRNRKNYTQDDASRDLAKIMRSYHEILANKRMERELTAIVTPTEIFANGDVGDSGFDLIHDLDLIEEILFIDKGKVYLNQKPFVSKATKLTGESGGDSTENGGILTYGFPENNSQEKQEKIVQNTAKTKNLPTPNSTANTFTLDDLISGAPMNRCVATSPLQNALDEYEKRRGKNEADASTPHTSNDRGNSKSAPSKDASSDALSNAPISEIPAPEFAVTAVKPAGAFVGAEDNTCAQLGGTLLYSYRTKISGVEKELFCVNLIERTRTYSMYYPGRSCIQCMVAGMNESMKALLSKNLVPNKLTGNTYESAKCKSSLQLSNMLDLNVTLVPTPVITPRKYGKLPLHDIGKTWEKFAKWYRPFGMGGASDTKRTQREALQNLGGGTTGSDGKERNAPAQTDVLSEVQAAIAQHIGEIEQRNASLATDSLSAYKNETYQQLGNELRQMTNYFKFFQDIFTRFNEETCSKLLDKPILDQK